MAPLVHWRATLAPGIDPVDVGDIPLAESLADHIRRSFEEIAQLRKSKAEILREVAEILDAEIRGDQPPAPADSWRLGMARAVKVIRMRADDLDPTGD